MRSSGAPNGPAVPGQPPPRSRPEPTAPGYIPTPIWPPRFSNYPAAVPGPLAALRAALLSPEKCQGLNALGGGERGSLGRLHRAAWGTGVAQPSPSSLRARSLVGREDGGGGGEPSSSVMLMKPTRVSKLMTLDQNPPRLAGPGDSRAGGLICIKECGGGLLAGEVWRPRPGFLVLTPSPRPGRC